jgi:hypothetical protein
MYENIRTKRLALLGVAAIVLGLGAIAPAFAWTASQTTTILCYSSGTYTPCASTSLLPSGSSIEDQAALKLNNYACSGGNCGTISFYVVSGTAPLTCPSKLPSGATAEGVVTVPTTASTGTGSGTTTTTYTSSSPTLVSSGSYYFYVAYNPGSSGYPSSGSDSAKPQCEPFSGGPFSPPPPPSTVPQFPLGMALLLGLAIPGLLVAKSKYTGRKSTFPV